MAHHNYLIGHNTSPDRNKTNPSRLTALTPQNQPERPLLRGNHALHAFQHPPLRRHALVTLGFRFEVSRLTLGSIPKLFLLSRGFSAGYHGTLEISASPPSTVSNPTAHEYRSFLFRLDNR